MEDAHTDAQGNGAKLFHVKYGLKWGTVIGLLFGVCFFVSCYCISTIPPTTPLSLSLASRPWSRILFPSLVVFLITGGIAFVVGALRRGLQETAEDMKSETHHTELTSHNTPPDS